jgi:hypothetical protein
MKKTLFEKEWILRLLSLIYFSAILIPLATWVFRF